MQPRQHPQLQCLCEPGSSFRVRQKSGEGVVRRSGCPKGRGFLESPFLCATDAFSAPLKHPHFCLSWEICTNPDNESCKGNRHNIPHRFSLYSHHSESFGSSLNVLLSYASLTCNPAMVFQNHDLDLAAMGSGSATVTESALPQNELGDRKST